jgi:membrane protease YdiL (CAAX protease family)
LQRPLFREYARPRTGQGKLIVRAIVWKVAVGVVIAAVPVLLVVAGRFAAAYVGPEVGIWQPALSVWVMAAALCAGICVLLLLTPQAFLRCAAPQDHGSRLSVVVWSAGSVFLSYLGALAVLAIPEIAVETRRIMAAEAEFISLLPLSVGVALGVGYLALIVCEETLFRWWLLRILRRQLPAGFSVCAVAAAFAASHATVWNAVGILPLSIWWTLIAWRTGSLVHVSIVHLFTNSVALLLAPYCFGSTPGLSAWCHWMAWLFGCPLFFYGVWRLTAYRGEPP